MTKAQHIATARRLTAEAAEQLANGHDALAAWIIEDAERHIRQARRIGK